MNTTFRNALLSGVALAAIVVAAPESANAQMYSTGPGFYLSVEGRYVFNEQDKIRDFPFNNLSLPFTIGSLSTINALKEKAGNGWGGKAMLGYRFNNNFDFGLGFQGAWFKKGKGSNSASIGTTFQIGSETFATITGTASQSLETKLNYHVGDFEAGYNWKMGNSNIRLFGGLRYANFNSRTTGQLGLQGGIFTATTAPTSPATGTIGTGTAALSVKRKTSYWGIGPRIGVNGQFGLGAGGFHIFGSVAGALLYGRYKDERKINAALNVASPPLGTVFGVGVTSKDKSKYKVVPNLEGELGLGYTFSAGSGSTLSIQAGYRADAYWGAGGDADVYALSFNGNDFGSKGSSSSDYLFHGPFVRLTATFGSAAPVAAAPPPAPAPAPMPKKNFLVFFDFDRSNITADAQRVITEAAAAAKAGNVSRIQLTGHTDRSGSDQYNMALSLRRGEAVKQALIRQGIPAASIAVIGRGESQPLVPTADGVREPQNRRVEILL